MKCNVYRWTSNTTVTIVCLLPPGRHHLAKGTDDMLKTERKTYEAPKLQELGAMKDITEAGDQPNADQMNGRNNTAFPPGS